MPLKTPQQYIETLRDGRVTYWDGERIDDVTTHPRFKVPIAMTAKDYNYDDPEYRDSRRYRTEDGDWAHRIYQIPRSEKDLAERVDMMGHSAISTLTTGVFMALMSVKDQIAEVNPKYAENIDRIYRYARDNDLYLTYVIINPQADRSKDPSGPLVNQGVPPPASAQSRSGDVSGAPEPTRKVSIKSHRRTGG